MNQHKQPIKIKVDIGIVSTADTLNGQVRLQDRRLSMRLLKMLTRREMKEWFNLTDTEVENAIRYWAVRGFTKVR
jgi:hypothetical protein